MFVKTIETFFAEISGEKVTGITFTRKGMAMRTSVENMTSSWKESALPCYEGGHAFENDLFRVVHYGFSLHGGIMVKRDHWRAYRKADGNYINGKCEEFRTKEAAMKATEQK